MLNAEINRNHFKFEENREVLFKLRKITLIGNTIFSDEQLAELYSDKILKTISFSDLKKIVDDITQRYRRAGYILTRAILPAQKISTGVVRIQIFEGYVSSFALEPNLKQDKKLLHAYGKKIMHDRPLTLKTLERYTLLANDLPNVTNLQAIIEPSKKILGSSDVTFVGSEKKYSALLGLDNRGSQYTGKVEFFFAGNINSMLRGGDTTGIQAVTTNKKDGMLFINVNHQTPLGDNGTQLVLSESYARSSPGLVVQPLNIRGTAHIFSSQVSHPFVRSRLINFYGNVKLDVIDNSANLFNTPLFSDRISSIRLGFVYDITDTISGLNTVDFSFSQGLYIFNASRKNDPTVSRPGASSDYSKLTLEISRLQKLPDPFSILIAIRGQYAFNALLSAEQFTYGGSIYGRAYNPSAITGDDGLSGKAELRYTQYLNYEFCKEKKYNFTFSTAEYYTFYDYGIIWKPLPLTTKNYENGSSVGLGVRVNIGNIFAYTELAQPLIRVLTADQSQTKSLRLFLGAFYKF